MALGDDDLDVFLEDANATVRRGSYSAPGWFDVSDDLQNDRSGYAVMARRTSVLVKAGSLGTVEQDATITVTRTVRGAKESTDYNVSHVAGEPPDMAFERITLTGGED